MATLSGFPGGLRDGTPPTPAEITRFAIIGLIVVLVVLLGLTTVYQVEADEVSVVQRFGAYVRRSRCSVTSSWSSATAPSVPACAPRSAPGTSPPNP